VRYVATLLMLLSLAGCTPAASSDVPEGMTKYVIPAGVLTGASGGSRGTFDLGHSHPYTGSAR
jgi:hypothetical protein